MRTGREARQTFRRWKRSRTADLTQENGKPYLDGDGKPISVQGHCVGAVSRALMERSAGYEDAHAVLDACVIHGVLRHGKPPTNAVVVYSGGRHGHLALKATIGRGIWGVDISGTAYTPGRVGRARGYKTPCRLWGYRYEGYVLPDDVPGWS